MSNNPEVKETECFKQLKDSVIALANESVEFFCNLENHYDRRFVLESNGEYRGVQLMLAGGGPTIWADFSTGYVEGHWGGDTYSFDILSEVRWEVVDYYESLLPF